MQREIRVLRFQEGAHSRHPTPEAAVSHPPPGTPLDAGEVLIVVVDLDPPLPHRSRELRTIVVETYWRVSGSIVARMRRALAEANRYLVHENFRALVGSKIVGSLTCAVFTGDEVFFGQVGAGHAFVVHPDGRMEHFPPRDRLLIPLAGTVPPLIHVGYAVLQEGSFLLLATTPVAEAQARDRWQAVFAPAARHPSEEAWARVTDRIQRTMVNHGVSGTAVLVQVTAEEEASPVPQREGTAGVGRLRVQWPGRGRGGARRGPRVVLTSVGRRLRQGVRALLPVSPVATFSPSPRVVPGERAPVAAGVALGVMMLVAFITLSVYMRLGGSARAEQLLDEAREVQELAYRSQDPEDWRRLLHLTEQIITLDPESTEAEQLRTVAETALGALEKAAMLNVHLLQRLGTASMPRRLVVAQGWVYVLDTTTDVVLGFPLKEDGVSLSINAPVVILKRGQDFRGDVVRRLVDLAWVEPNLDYPDGALFIYGEEGNLYIYKPTLGPPSITRQHLLGDLAAGMVTLVDAFGDRFYVVHRQQNQIFTYEPVNGIYENPRAYFAQEVAPELQNVLDIAIDGRIYLLMGDGKVLSYFNGVEDPSFTIRDLPEPVRPVVLAIESDPEQGRVFLGDSQRGRIIVLDKRGRFLYQYRLPALEDESYRLEALAVSEKSSVVYFVAADGLYAAPLPFPSP